MNRIRLVVVDDHALFRAGLVSLLSKMPELEVVGEADDGLEALAVIHSAHPQVVLLDVNMPVMGGIETMRNIKLETERHGNPAPRVLMLTISKQDDDLFGAISAGADGYLLKNTEPADLRRAILAVAEGKGVLSPDVTARVLRAVSTGQLLQPEAGLSRREKEVLECLAQGMTGPQIASALFISGNTVKTHVRHILEKLEAVNRAEAIRKATQMGLIHLEDTK